jgi:hypothetical protein
MKSRITIILNRIVWVKNTLVRVMLNLLLVAAVLLSLGTAALTRKSIDEAKRKCHAECGNHNKHCMQKCWRKSFAPMHPASKTTHLVHNAGRTLPLTAAHHNEKQKKHAPHKAAFRTMAHPLIRKRK